MYYYASVSVKYFVKYFTYYEMRYIIRNYNT